MRKTHCLYKDLFLLLFHWYLQGESQEDVSYVLGYLPGTEDWICYFHPQPVFLDFLTEISFSQYFFLHHRVRWEVNELCLSLRLTQLDFTVGYWREERISILLVTGYQCSSFPVLCYGKGMGQTEGPVTLINSQVSCLSLFSPSCLPLSFINWAHIMN